MKSLLIFACAISLAFIFDTSVIAEEVVTDFGSETPSVDDFTRALIPESNTRSIRPSYNTRSIRPVNTSTVQEIPPESVTTKAANISLTFELNSASLTDEAKTVLNNLGPSIQGEQLSAYTFRIEGYTDASGEAIYNDWLSEQRANSVQSYLASNYGVTMDRLVTVGKGETELFDKKNPYSSTNRRVKIINIGLTK